MSAEILIVEDEEKIARVLVEYLSQAGFESHWIDHGSAALQAIATRQPALIVLDLMLPGLDGVTICREVRKHSQVPIIMLTARVDEIDRLLGLEVGADDYVCKPFSPREVVARIRTILRRVSHPSASPKAQQLAYRGLELDLDTRLCTLADKELQLTPVEFALLATLLKRPGRVYSRDDLMANAYPDNRVVAPRTIDSHMKNLRTKVNTLDPDLNLIHSIYAVGYKLE